MAYLRFLTDKDYISLVTDEHWKQIIRDVPERIVQAEQRAEMNMLEYLDQYYEIEQLLNIGKNIREHNVAVSYPSQVYIKKDGEIYRTLTSLNGYKKPTKKVYWKKLLDFVDPRLMENAKKYSQLRMYAKGEVVIFGTEYWICLIPHGYEVFKSHIQIFVVKILFTFSLGYIVRYILSFYIYIFIYFFFCCVTVRYCNVTCNVTFYFFLFPMLCNTHSCLFSNLFQTIYILMFFCMHNAVIVKFIAWRIPSKKINSKQLVKTGITNVAIGIIFSMILSWTLKIHCYITVKCRPLAIECPKLL